MRHVTNHVARVYMSHTRMYFGTELCRSVLENLTNEDGIRFVISAHVESETAGRVRRRTVYQPNRDWFAMGTSICDVVGTWVSIDLPDGHICVC